MKTKSRYSKLSRGRRPKSRKSKMTFHQSIFDEGHTPNTVIHYHAVIRRALQNAVKKEIINSNPADRVDRPKKNVYQAQFYSA